MKFHLLVVSVIAFAVALVVATSQVTAAGRASSAKKAQQEEEGEGERCSVDLEFDASRLPSSPNTQIDDLTSLLRYNVTVNNGQMLFNSGSAFVGQSGIKKNNKPVFFQAAKNTSGFDGFGQFNELSIEFSLAKSTQPDFAFVFRAYKQGGAGQDKLVFSQRYYDKIENVAVADKPSHNLVSTSFPSFSTSSERGSDLGLFSFAGTMAGNMYPQSSTFTAASVKKRISGGIKDSSMMIFYTKPASLSSSSAGASQKQKQQQQVGQEEEKISLAVSPLSEFMAFSLATAPFGNDQQEIQYGLNANAWEIPAGFEIKYLLQCSLGGPNRGVRRWGRTMKNYYGKKDGNAHERDLSLRTLSHSTDNGAEEYYWSDNYKNYLDYFKALKTYSQTKGVPYRVSQLDSWWYFKEDHCQIVGVPCGGILNWTAQPKLLPGGLQELHNATKWPTFLHSRFYAWETDYASNPPPQARRKQLNSERQPKFPFVWAKKYSMGVPEGRDFWDYLFSDVAKNYAMEVFEHDWLSTIADNLDAVTANLTFGRKWLTDMAETADAHGVSIQYCMSYPRHILSSLPLSAVTQARASNDYQPQNAFFGNDHCQWRLGESSLWIDSIGIAPSKDNYWSSRKRVLDPHYSSLVKTYEYRNRLEALVSSMSNGVQQPGDGLDSDVELLLKSCMADGTLLRPDQAASPLDSYFYLKAFVNANPPPRQSSPCSPSNDPVLHFTKSEINHGLAPGFQLKYVYLLSVTTGQGRNITFDDILMSTYTGHHSLHKEQEHDEHLNYFLAYEANTTGKLRVVSQDVDLQLAPSDSYSFEYFTLVPVYANLMPKTGFVFLGETTKWIAASNQRIQRVIYDSEFTKVQVMGSHAGEIVRLSFGHQTNMKVLAASCKVGPQLTLEVIVDSAGRIDCRPF